MADHLAEIERLMLLRAADARSRDELSAALAEAQRREELMRPVVEKAQRYVAELVGLDDLESAVDTYETQTGGTE